MLTVLISVPNPRGTALIRSLYIRTGHLDCPPNRALSADPCHRSIKLRGTRLEVSFWNLNRRPHYVEPLTQDYVISQIHITLVATSPILLLVLYSTALCCRVRDYNLEPTTRTVSVRALAISAPSHANASARLRSMA